MDTPLTAFIDWSRSLSLSATAITVANHRNHRAASSYLLCGDCSSEKPCSSRGNPQLWGIQRQSKHLQPTSPRCEAAGHASSSMIHSNETYRPWQESSRSAVTIQGPFREYGQSPSRDTREVISHGEYGFSPVGGLLTKNRSVLTEGLTERQDDLNFVKVLSTSLISYRSIVLVCFLEALLHKMKHSPIWHYQNPSQF